MEKIDKKLWFFFRNYIVKGFPNTNLQPLLIVYGTREEARQQAFEKLGSRWVEYPADEFFQMQINKGRKL